MPQDQHDQHDLDEELRSLVRGIVDANRYMVLATVDAEGRPWVSPVFYGAADYRAFYWISAPQVTHSRNLAHDPRVSIVIFDSTVLPGNGQAVYVAATAEQVIGGEAFEQGLRVFSGADLRGGWAFTAAELTEPAPYRLYRAVAHEHAVLCPRDSGVPCVRHGHSFDHRAVVEGMAG